MRLRFEFVFHFPLRGSPCRVFVANRRDTTEVSIFNRFVQTRPHRRGREAKTDSGRSVSTQNFVPAGLVSARTGNN
jgi:hypothetical protein